MAEAIAVLGLIASMGQLIEVSTTLVSRLHHFSATIDKLPDCFTHLATQLPLLNSSVRTLRRRLSPSGGQETPQADDKELENVVEALDKELSDIDHLLAKTLSKEDASSLGKGVKAIKSIKIQSRIEHHAEVVRSYISILNAFMTVRSEEGIGVLVRTLTQSTVSDTLQVREHKPSLPRRKPIRLLDVDAEENFVGRIDVLEDIEGKFTNGERRVALAGIGGVG